MEAKVYVRVKIYCFTYAITVSAKITVNKSLQAFLLILIHFKEVKNKLFVSKEIGKLFSFFKLKNFFLPRL